MKSTAPRRGGPAEGTHPPRATWRNLPRRIAVLPIRLYQRVISPLTPPSCRFEPSCSEYGAQAVLAHGALKGVLLAAWRILRCHPFTEGGLDPVPAPGRWRTGPGAPPCNHDADRGSSGR